MIHSSRRTILALAAAALLLTPAFARAQSSGPTAPIEALDAGLLKVMKAGNSTPFPQRFQMLKPVVEQTFDLKLILRNAIGLRWGKLGASQQAQLQQVFDQFTVANYVSEFSSYDGQKFTVSPNPRAAGGDQIVQTSIVSGGDSNRLDYVMRNEGGTWKVVDVLLDGSISQVAVTRSDFRSLLSADSAGTLIESLKKKVSSLSGGTMQ